MKQLRRLLDFLCALHFPVFTFIMGLAFMVPIYTDEIAWKMIEARYFLDGNALIYLFPQCKSAFFIQPPGWSLPIYWIQALLYSDLTHLFKLRILGWFSFI